MPWNALADELERIRGLLSDILFHLPKSLPNLDFGDSSHTRPLALNETILAEYMISVLFCFGLKLWVMSSVIREGPSKNLIKEKPDIPRNPGHQKAI